MDRMLSFSWLPALALAEQLKRKQNTVLIAGNVGKSSKIPWNVLYVKSKLINAACMFLLYIMSLGVNPVSVTEISRISSALFKAQKRLRAGKLRIYTVIRRRCLVRFRLARLSRLEFRRS